MDLKYVRNELQKLSELVGGWDVSEDIPVLERDLVLEKLRKLYDNVRFDGAGESAPAAVAEYAPVPEEAALSIDLGEILAFDPATDPEPYAEPAPVSVAVETTAPQCEPAAGQSVPSFGIETVTEPAGVSAVIPAAPAAEQPERRSVSGAETVAESGAAAEPACDPAGDSAGESPVVQSVPETGPAPAPIPEPAPPTETVPEPAPETGTAPASTPEPAPRTATNPEPASETGAVSEPAHAAPSQPVAPTLFELEETVRHRRKQRVIMSLYDADAPMESRTPEKAIGEKPAAGESPAPRSRTVSADAGSQAEIPTEKTSPGEIPAVPEPFRAPAEDEAPAEPAAKAAKSVESSERVENTPATSIFATGEDEPEGPAFEEITLEERPSGSVLGDVINHDVQTLADTLARPRDVASELRRSEPVTDLRRAIGINDKFLMIRDLFGGDSAAYEAAVDALNGFDNLDDCMIHIAENYAWNPDSDGAKFIMELLERKFA